MRTGALCCWAGAAIWWLLVAIALSTPCVSALSLEDEESLEQPVQLHRRPWLALAGAEETDPDDPYISQMLSRLRALRDADQLGLAQKRALDFGMGRGFSGSRAAKHLMGLAAAAYPAGPGRRRR